MFKNKKQYIYVNSDIRWTDKLNGANIMKHKTPEKQSPTKKITNERHREKRKKKKEEETEWKKEQKKYEWRMDIYDVLWMSRTYSCPQYSISVSQLFISMLSDCVSVCIGE